MTFSSFRGANMNFTVEDDQDITIGPANNETYDKIKKIYTNALYHRSCQLIPMFERNWQRDFCETNNMPFDETEFCQRRAMLIWLEPICNTCMKKPPEHKMYRCTCCGLVTYCGKDCQRSQSAAHKAWIDKLPSKPRQNCLLQNKNHVLFHFLCFLQTHHIGQTTHNL